MGLRYVWFRLVFEFRKRSGLLQSDFPSKPNEVALPDLRVWKEVQTGWPWLPVDSNTFPKSRNPELERLAREILEGKINLFNSTPHQFSGKDSWLIHPESGFRYDSSLHWTQIPDFSPVAGDIKYVWEKSRFSFLHPILRYDHHFDLDHSDWVFSEMESWISANPINCGPNYRCSQEISLRVFNWLGALQFYKNSPFLTEHRWNLFIKHMYWQVHHVRNNIQFSRIAVRNNHAITETLALYIFGSLFPDIPGAAEWRKSGKKWFEEEIEYQIYEDGSYLQFSMNYHRVVVQLLTLALRFADIRGDRFSDVVYQRAAASLKFLRSFQDSISGQLPNYGANDGALFFQFSDKPYRQYTDQLNALEAALTGTSPALPDGENANWFGKAEKSHLETETQVLPLLSCFPKGGYAGIREEETLTFFRCGNHKDRPSQADNLHVDLWHRGENIFRDAGSYKYNALPDDQRYFFGSRSHNVIMVNGQDQMEKGPRFVWLNWSQARFLKTGEDSENWYLEGEISAFQQIRAGITHRRKITKSKSGPVWVIEDFLSGLAGEKLELLWHPSPAGLQHFSLHVEDQNQWEIKEKVELGWYSGLYGKKEESPFFVFENYDPYFKTTIRPKG